VDEGHIEGDGMKMEGEMREYEAWLA